MDTSILAQIFGFLGVIAMFLGTWQKTRKGVLSFLTLDCLFYSIQYTLLGALTGTFTNIIGLIRTIIFSYKEKNKYLQSNLILYIMIILYLIVGTFTYAGLRSIFPIVASIVYSIVLWQDNVKQIRFGTSVMILSWFIYNISVGAYVGALFEGILFISSIMAIIKIDILKDKGLKQIDKKIKQ